MHIRNLHVENLKLVRSLDLSFTNADGSPRMWTALVGENGLCKTALLQAIALAAAGHERGNQLVSAQVGSARALTDRRQPDAATAIEAELGFSRERHRQRRYPGLGDPLPAAPPLLKSRIVLPPRASVLHGTSSYQAAPNGPGLVLDPRVPNPLSAARSELDIGPDGKERPLGDWLVAAYGVSRALLPPSSMPVVSDVVLDRFRALFDISHQILGVRFADVLGMSTAYSVALRDALVKGTKKILPRVKNVELRGRDGVKTTEDLLLSHRFEWSAGGETIKLPAVWLSQGYQGTIAWIADLIGQAYWEARQPFKIGELEGLVLIDELDLHLHPRWQVDLVPALREAFPRVQFVVTTHSPMLLPGFRKDEIVRLCLDADGNVTRDGVARNPALMTGSEIYSQFFGIDDLYPTELARDLRRYGYLAANPRRTDAEDAEVWTLRDRLTAAGIQLTFQPEQRGTQP